MHSFLSFVLFVIFGAFLGLAAVFTVLVQGLTFP